MAAVLRGELAGRAPQRVHVLLPRPLERGPVHPLRLVAGLLREREARRIVVEAALRPLHEVDAAVGARRRGAVLHHDRAAARRADDGGVHVAREPLGAALPGVRRIGGLGELAVGGGERRHRDDALHPVAAVDVHVEADRAERVRGVGVAEAVDRAAAEVRAVAEVVLELAPHEVVDVAALGVDERAEQALVREVPREHLHLAVAAVLEHHAVAAGLLARLDDLPRLVERLRARHLGEHVLAGAQRVEDDPRVQRRGRGHVDDVDVRVVAHRLPRLLRPAVDPLRAGAPPLLEPRLRALALVAAQVGERGRLRSGNAGHAEDRGRAALPDSDEADADPLHRRSGEVAHGLRLIHGGGFGCVRAGSADAQRGVYLISTIVPGAASRHCTT